MTNSQDFHNLLWC